MRRILVVEDDEAILDALAALLEDAGYQAVPARDGRAALDALRSGEKPCAILLDIAMPVMNGWLFRGEQMKDPALADVPVIICTADRDADKRASELGAADWLRKPIDPDRLLGLIERHCRGPRSSS